MNRKERLDVLMFLISSTNLILMVPTLVGHPLPVWAAVPLIAIGLGYLVVYWVEYYDKGGANG